MLFTVSINSGILAILESVPFVSDIVIIYVTRFSDQPPLAV
jgi:hypothetical protein